MQIPLTSAFEPLRRLACSHKQMIVLNKVDLADRSLTEVNAYGSFVCGMHGLLRSLSLMFQIYGLIHVDVVEAFQNA